MQPTTTSPRPFVVREELTRTGIQERSVALTEGPLTVALERTDDARRPDRGAGATLHFFHGTERCALPADGVGRLALTGADIADLARLVALADAVLAEADRRGWLEATIAAEVAHA